MHVNTHFDLIYFSKAQLHVKEQGCEVLNQLSKQIEIAIKPSNIIVLLKLK